MPHRTLILCGRDDAFQKLAQGERLATTIARAKSIVIDDAAHWIRAAKPAEITARLGTFVDPGDAESPNA